jgi:hypothetical protein
LTNLGNSWIPKIRQNEKVEKLLLNLDQFAFFKSLYQAELSQAVKEVKARPTHQY